MVSCKIRWLGLLAMVITGGVPTPWAQVTIKGRVVDAETQEPVIGAAVVVKGTSKGVATDTEGRFSLQVQRLPVTLNVSSIGFKKTDYEVRSADQKIEISLKADKIFLQSIDIEDSRITQKQQEQPLTVESLDLIAIRETPAGNFYDGLANMKGVDITAASLGFKVINARGFNSTSPVRSLQLIDGVDNQSPGLNFSLGNFLGSPELDVKKVELIQGASSSYFGPNAFNGVINMETKSPFEFPGLNVLVKMGERSLFEGGLRWAHKFQNRAGRDVFAYKVNAYYMRARDWEATNYAPATDSKAGPDNPGGYDAVNRYGDEYLGGKNDFISDSSEFKLYPGLGVIYRDGYREVDLVDYEVENIKSNVALHGMLSPKVELLASSSFSFGTTVYQGENRFRLKDVLFFQHRLEVREKDKWFLRTYATHEDAGKSYDAVVTAFMLQNNCKPNNKWYNDYSNYYQINFALPGQEVWQLPGFPAPSFAGDPRFIDSALKVLNMYKDSLWKWHQMARAYANSNQGLAGGLGIYPYFPAGSYEFDTAFAGITSRPLGRGGARFFDRSALWHTHGEYKFKIGTLMDLTAGANFRLYMPNSRGTIFSDTSGRVIRNYEGGLYAGLEARLGKVKLNMAHRLDKNVNFPLLWSPALSVVYTPQKEHTLRLSFASAIRNPTLADQYLYYNVGRAILLGNLRGFRNLITVPSFVDYFDHLDTSRLEYMVIKPVRPERVWTTEVGYRGTLFKRVYVDLSAYYSIYQNFIGYKLGV
ncbi:MAG: TonB-dependent receptor, partial [Flavobacteriales bacterium]|nr:TonB-dependent receptor [Flavobacteriales bacterium]MDW8410586.1 TonB-dependent receptor [Flavobacteriales bacterium]